MDLQEWLQWRRGGIGGSDAPAICNVDPRKGPMAVYLDKAGLIPLGRQGREDEAMRWGHLLEDAITLEFEQRRGLFVRGQQTAVVGKVPWMRATVDGFVLEHDAVEEPSGDIFKRALGLLEVKTASQRTSDWKDDAGDPKLPDNVAVQVQHGLAVTGMPLCFVAVLLMWPTPRLVIFEVERDQEVIDALFEMELDFWRRVQHREPPPADGFDATADALRVAFAKPKGGTVELTPEVIDFTEAYRVASTEERAAAGRKQAAMNAIMAFLGEREVGTFNGKVVLTWTGSKRKRFDVAALREAEPEIAERFTVEEPSRRFTLKPRSIVDAKEDDE